MTYNDEDVEIMGVIRAADRAEPRVADTSAMADTLKLAQTWLFDHHFNQVQLDRWDHVDGVSIELGFAHGEVWYRGWVRQEKESWPVTKMKATSLHPGDLEPLTVLIGLLGANVEAL